MNELEQMKQELERLTKKVEELERREEEQQKSGYPEEGENYYTIGMSVSDWTPCVHECRWEGDAVDKFNWDYYHHGSIDKAKVEWTIKRIELVNEIKQHTRPFQKGEDNYCFIRKHRYGVPELDINLYSSLDVGCEYDYFASEDEALKFMYNNTKELLLKYLFKPADGDYKAIMEEVD